MVVPPMQKKNLNLPACLTVLFFLLYAIELDLDAKPLSPSSPAATVELTRSDQKQLKSFLGNTGFSSSIRRNLLKLVKKDPAGRRWVAQNRKQIYALVAIKLSPNSRPQIKTRMQGLATKKSTSALYLGKAVLSQFKADDLTNLSALYDALLSISSNLNLKGKAKHVQHQTGQIGGWVFSVAMAPIESITANLKSNQINQVVRTRYGKAISVSAQKAMKKEEWATALSLWEHLHRRELLTPSGYLDVVYCFEQRGAKADALALLKEAFWQFGKDADVTYLNGLAERARALNTADSNHLLLEISATIDGRN